MQTIKSEFSAPDSGQHETTLPRTWYRICCGSTCCCCCCAAGRDCLGCGSCSAGRCSGCKGMVSTASCIAADEVAGSCGARYQPWICVWLAFLPGHRLYLYIQRANKAFKHGVGWRSFCSVNALNPRLPQLLLTICPASRPGGNVLQSLSIQRVSNFLCLKGCALMLSVSACTLDGGLTSAFISSAASEGFICLSLTFCISFACSRLRSSICSGTC